MTANKNNYIAFEYEKALLKYGYWVAIAVISVILINDFLIDSPLSTRLINALGVVTILFSLWLHNKYYRIALILFYLINLISIVGTWNAYNGWDGPLAYDIIILMIFTILTSHGWIQYITLAIYCVLIYLLNQDWFTILLGSSNQNYKLLDLEIDFFIRVLAIVLVTRFLKMRFYNHREEVSTVSTSLQKSILTLKEQTNKLDSQQQELAAIQNNLQHIIDVRTQAIQEKSEVLTSFAFVNAHKVRGPLARVMGMISLIEMDNPNHPQKELLAEMKEEAQKMDQIIRQINEVVN